VGLIYDPRGLSGVTGLARGLSGVTTTRPGVAAVLQYIGAVKTISTTSSTGPKRSEIAKWLGGSTFEIGPGSAMNTLSHKTIKSVESVNNHAFEGEGNTLLGQNKETRGRRSPGILPKLWRSNPNAWGWRFSRIWSASITGLAHRDWTLPVRGYCWGCGAEPHKGIHCRALPHASVLHQ
jgi:hypothetical protein